MTKIIYIITKVIKHISLFLLNIKNKFNLFAIMERIFTKSNISKIFIIFSVGFLTRLFISYYYNINVFIEFLNYISIIYYSLMAIFAVVLSEVFTYFDLNIFPKFIFEYFIEFNQSIIKSTRQLILKILNLSYSDFSIKSIFLLFKRLVNYNLNESNKLTITDANIETDKKDKPFKITYVLNKNGDGDKTTLPKTTYKGDKTTLPNRTYKVGESSYLTPDNVNNGSSSKVDTNKSNTSVNSSEKSIQTLPFIFRGDPNDINDISRRPSSTDIRQIETYPRSSVYSQDSPVNRGLQDFSLYDEPSNFNTPSTMTPLFNNSQINIERNSLLNRSNNSLYPAPLNIPNTISPNYEANSLVRSSLSRTRPSAVTHPYDLSGNGVLPNVTFNNVTPIRGNIPLNNQFTINRNLPLITNSHEINTNLNNVADSPRIDDPTSFQYISRHRARIETKELSYEQNNHYLSQLNHEVDINSPGIKGKVKLIFKNIGDKFTNGVNKIESACIKYETVSKRHIIWYLIEESSGRYESYEDFKKDWDSNKSVWKEIKDRTKQDLKSTVEGALGFSDNRPTIKRNMNREIEDLLHTKRPFHKSNIRANPDVISPIRANPDVISPVRDNPDLISPNDNQSNQKTDEGNKGKDRHVHKSSHKHSHRHHSHRHHSHRHHSHRHRKP